MQNSRILHDPKMSRLHSDYSITIPYTITTREKGGGSRYASFLNNFTKQSVLLKGITLTKGIKGKNILCDWYNVDSKHYTAIVKKIPK